MQVETLKHNKIYNFLGYLQLPLLIVGLITFLFSYYSIHSNTGSYLSDSSYLFLNIIALFIAISYSFRPTYRIRDLLTAGTLLVLFQIPFFYSFFQPSPFQGLLAFFHKLFTFGGSIEIFFLCIIGAEVYKKFLSRLTLVIVIILIPINIFLIYANTKDLTLKNTLSYKINGVFESVEGCNNFFSPIRVNECKLKHIKYYDQSK